MSELDVTKLRGIVATASDGRTTHEIIQFVRTKHAAALKNASDYLIDKSLATMVERSRRRRATAVLNDGFDLFEEFSVKGQRLVETRDAAGKVVKRNVNLRDVTIGQMKEEIQRIENRALPEHKELTHLKRMVERAQKFGSDDTTLGEALTKAHTGL